MIYRLENPFLKVDINSFGAEIVSMKDMENVEYLWQGDKEYWEDQSPVLFPYIGRLKNEQYKFQDVVYSMKIHGFAMSSEFLVTKHTETEIHFVLKDSDKTREMYPFCFELHVSYQLCDNQLSVNYNVFNNSNEKMYFGIGGHPGFNVPLEPDIMFEEYCLEFSEESHPTRIGFNSKCFINGKDEPFELIDGKKINLAHDMFDEDAIVLRDMDKSVRLFSGKGKKSVELKFHDMDYLGIWHAPRKNAPYVCIEPWSSLPDDDVEICDLKKKSDLLQLDPGMLCVLGWQILIHQ